MTQSGNFFLSDKDFTADRAVLAFGQAGIYAISSNSCVDYFSVTQSSNYFLGNKDFTADRAVLAFGQAGFGAVGSNGSVNNLSMTQSGNFFLFNINFAANGALLAFRQTGFGTGGSLTGNRHLGVTLGFDYILCNQHFTASITVLAFGKTGGITASCNGSIDHFGVTQGGNLFLSNQHLAANGAVLAFGLTGGGTGSLHSLRGGGGMVQGFKDCLGNYSLTTDRALGAVSQTGFATGGSLAGNSHFRVTQSIDFGILIAGSTSYAGMGGIALIYAGRSSHNTFAIAMAGLIPLAGGCVILVLTCNICGNIGAVVILQNYGVQGNFRPASDIGTIGGDLIGNGFRTGGQIDHAGTGGVDIGATIGGINSTCRSIHCAIHLNQSILQSALNASTAGDIHSLHIGQVAGAGITVGAVIIEPLVKIVNNDLLAGTQGAGSTFSDIELTAGLEGNRLVHSNVAAFHGDGQVLGNGKRILGRINGQITNEADLHRHTHGGNGHITVDLHIRTAFAFQIVLHDIAGIQNKHGVLAADERYIRFLYAC